MNARAAGIVLSGLMCALLAAVAQAEGAAASAPALADVDPSNDDVVAPPQPIADCESKLRAAGVDFAPAELKVTPGNAKRPTCGVEQAVVYRHGPAGVRYSPSPPLVSCNVALGLARFERLLNEEAERNLGQSVVRVEQGGTYNCRKMARFALVSEHSYANAIDIRSVTLKNGRKLSVLTSFGKTDAEPKRPEARFWRTLANRLYDEGAFSVVITPFFDGLHRDHLHLDQARYRVDGSRPSR
ncbi:MAG TPA: extensin family protein [Polyangiaceae bacterium]|nr:extensin family protein [Polyangiaceae bacterium]